MKNFIYENEFFLNQCLFFENLVISLVSVATSNGDTPSLCGY